MNVVITTRSDQSKFKGRPKDTRLQRTELDVLLGWRPSASSGARGSSCRARELTLPADWVLATSNAGKVAELSALLAARIFLCAS